MSSLGRRNSGTQEGLGIPSQLSGVKGVLRFAFYALISLLTLAALPSFAAVDLFRQGLDAYAVGAHDEAASSFRELSTNRPSSAVLHNLGNAEWKRGQTGEAILAWERAQWLDPFAPNTRANLRFARHVTQLPSPTLVW